MVKLSRMCSVPVHLSLVRQLKDGKKNRDLSGGGSEIDKHRLLRDSTVLMSGQLWPSHLELDFAVQTQLQG
jgi:hypothetical protein